MKIKIGIIIAIFVFFGIAGSILHYFFRNQEEKYKVYFNIGQKLISKQQYKRAIYYLNKAKKEFPYSPYTYYNLGLAYENILKYPEAISNYSHMISLLPDNIDALYRKGMVLIYIGQFTNAKQTFNQLTSFHPMDPTGYNGMGDLYLMLGDYNISLNYYNRALKIKTNFHSIHNRGVVFMELNQLNNAIRDFNYAIHSWPQNSYSYYNLACVYSLQKNFHYSISNLSKAVSLGYADLNKIDTDKQLDFIRDSSDFMRIRSSLKGK